MDFIPQTTHFSETTKRNEHKQYKSQHLNIFHVEKNNTNLYVCKKKSIIRCGQEKTRNYFCNSLDNFVQIFDMEFDIVPMNRKEVCLKYPRYCIYFSFICKYVQLLCGILTAVILGN